MTPEFSRPYRLDTIGGEPRRVTIEAQEGERAALAARFGLASIGVLAAEATIRREGQQVWATGRLRAQAVQNCVATGESVPAKVDEPFSWRFDPAGEPGREDDLELGEGDLDILSYEGGAIDLGEAVAQDFALALDPFPRAPGAEAALRDAGVKSEEEAEAAARAASPFAALKGLKGE